MKQNWRREQSLRQFCFILPKVSLSPKNVLKRLTWQSDSGRRPCSISLSDDAAIDPQ
ncbi:hypothetical protein [Cobetia marina]|uniref:hypothetical protein n=1 Tax=Cobetia marina TaxID=28258 RepID=UPI0038578E10